MTISTHTRVQRGYYRRYYAATAEVRRQKAREYYQCRCRRGWALWLIAELRKVWAEDNHQMMPMEEQPTPLSQATWEVLMSYVRDGHVKPLTGPRRMRIRSTG